MARYFYMNDTSIDDIDAVVPISQGGSGASTNEDAIAALGGISKLAIGAPGGVAKYGVRQATTSVVDFVTLDGPVSPAPNTTVTYQITNYDSLIPYILTGPVTRAEDIITYYVPAEPQHVMFTVNGRSIINPDVPLPNAMGRIRVDATNVNTGVPVTAVLEDADDVIDAVKWYIIVNGVEHISSYTGISATWVPAVAGTIEFRAMYSDTLGPNQVAVSETVTASYVAPVNRIGQIIVSSTKVYAGDTINARVEDANGVPNAQVTWMVDGMPMSSSGFNLRYTPEIPGPHVIDASYTDLDGYHESASVQIVALAQSNHTGLITVDTVPAQVGVPVRIRVSDIDGIRSAIVWRINGAVVPNVTGTSYMYTPSYPGDVTVTAGYMDSTGIEESVSKVFSADTVSNVAGTISMSSDSVIIGTDVIATLYDGNGIKGSVVWKVDGTVVPGTSNRLTYRPTGTGVHTIQAIYTDMINQTETPTTTVIAVAPGDKPGIVSMSAYEVVESTSVIARVDDDNGIVPPVVWKVNGVAQPGTGTSLVYTANQVGANVIQAQYVDRANNPSSPTATLIVTARINQPGRLKLSQSSVKVNTVITAELFDANGISGAVEWRINDAVMPYTGLTYTYPAATVGDISVSATYKDLLGETSTVTEMLKVYVPVDRVGTVTMSSVQVIEGDIITAQLSDPDGTNEITWTVYGAADVVLKETTSAEETYIYQTLIGMRSCRITASYTDLEGFTKVVSGDTVTVLEDNTVGVITAPAKAKANEVIRVSISDADGPIVGAVVWSSTGGTWVGTGDSIDLTCPDSPDPQTITVTATYTDHKFKISTLTTSIDIERGQVPGRLLISVGSVITTTHQVRPGDLIKIEVIDDNGLVPNTKAWTLEVDGVDVPLDVIDYLNGNADQGLLIVAPETPGLIKVSVLYDDTLGTMQLVSETITVSDTAVYV